MVDSSSGTMISVTGTVGCSAEPNGSVTSAITSRSTLNPLAPEWSLEKNRSTEDERCLFITFSRWLPTLNEREITWFFNQMFGRRCVQSVVLFRGTDQNPPLCAKVVFQLSHIPRVILAKENEVIFLVNSKSMRCKRYTPKKKQNQEGLTTME